jgi:hypothetical protein
MEITWEEPPQHLLDRRNRTGRYKDFAQELRNHPGKWAVLPGDKATESSAKGTAQSISNGKTGGFAPAKSFETVVDGTKIWVRFVGEQEPKEPGDDPADDVDEAGEEREQSDAPAAREWARRNGYQVPERGRLSNAVIDQYRAWKRDQGM